MHSTPIACPHWVHVVARTSDQPTVNWMFLNPLKFNNLLKCLTEFGKTVFLLDYQFIIKQYNSGTARWEGCREKGMGKRMELSWHLPVFGDPGSSPNPVVQGFSWRLHSLGTIDPVISCWWWKSMSSTLWVREAEISNPLINAWFPLESYWSHLISINSGVLGRGLLWTMEDTPFTFIILIT